jgi:hypothetical protein
VAGVSVGDAFSTGVVVASAFFLLKRPMMLNDIEKAL